MNNDDTSADLTERPVLQPAARHFERAAKASREHTALAQRLCEKHGDHGTAISGIVRDHFPEHDKKRLSALCKTICRENDAGRAARPYGVHKSTMDRLARAICKRDGTGFYGYRM